MRLLACFPVTVASPRWPSPKRQTRPPASRSWSPSAARPSSATSATRSTFSIPEKAGGADHRHEHDPLFALSDTQRAARDRLRHQRASTSRKSRPTESRRPFEFINGHIVVPAGLANRGENTISIEFTAGDASLNRKRRFPVHAVRAGARAPGVPGVRSTQSQGALDAHARRAGQMAGGGQRRRAAIATDRSTAA